MENKVSDLKNLIGHLDVERFKQTFNTQEECLEMLANAKWEKGFVCRNCGNDRYCAGRTLFSRRCTRCKKDESATAHTIFHHCRMELPLAFEIAYMVCGTPKIAASEISHILETRHMTCLNFKKRIIKCLKSGGKILNDENLK
jgi:hypothetical protein